MRKIQFSFCIFFIFSIFQLEAQSISKSELYRIDYSDGPYIVAVIEKKPIGYYGDVKSFYKQDTVMEKVVDNRYWQNQEIVDIPVMKFDEFLKLQPGVDTVETVLYDTLGNPKNKMYTFFSYWIGKWRFLYDLEIRDYNPEDNFNCYKSGKYYFAELDDVSVAYCEFIMDGEKYTGEHINTAVITSKKFFKRAKSINFEFIAYDMHGNVVYERSHTIKYLKRGKFFVL